MKKLIVALCIFAALGVGMRLGYNMAIKDAKLVEIDENSYSIKYGNEPHAETHYYPIDFEY